MTGQVRPEENSLSSILEKIHKKTSSEGDLGRLRVKAWDHFQELGLPGRKSEVFRYVPLRQLYATPFSAPGETSVAPGQIDPFVLPECAESILVFVNGSFSLSLSRLKAISSKVSLLPLTDAVRTYNAFFMNNWMKTLREETDPFAALNAALHQEGAFLYLSPKSIVESPVQVLHLVVADMPLIMMPRVHLFMGAQSELKLVSTNASLNGKDCLYNSVLDVHMEEGSYLTHYQEVEGMVPESWHYHALRGYIKRNCTLKSIDVTDGSKTVRADYKVVLAGEGAEALLNNLWMLSGKREAHTHVLMDHQAPNCHSMQLFKGALADFSRSSFEGKILVRQAAQKTDAFQLNNNLLLGERAHADSKPNLEIFADDVKASHGATFGQLDEEQLFYMRSRGFSKREAKSLLVYGYCKEILDMIAIPSLLERGRRKAQQFLTHEQADDDRSV